MKNKKIKNLVIGAVALLAFAFVGGDALARSLAELNRERQEVRDQQAELRAYLRIAQEEQDTILAELIMLDLEMMEATEAYINAQYALEATEQNLYETENRLAEAEAEREARFDILRNRLRFMHENNNLSYIELLLGSHSITEFLNNREHFRRIIEHDHNMISEIAALEEQIAADRDTIELQRLALVEQAAHLEYTMANLDAHMDYRIERLVYIAFAEEQALYNLAQLDTAEQRLSMDIAATQAREAAAAAARRTGSVNLNADAPMTWPVALAPHVNSPFGNRPNPFNPRRTEWHTGVDLRAPRGTPILAAEDGVVVFSGWMRGYGNTIRIDHSGGIVTLYAHNTTNQVRVGQEVTRGQQIATAGSTGNTTGPHLHFEVIRRGEQINPGPFIGLQ